jgi:hypothetical protein
MVLRLSPGAWPESRLAWRIKAVSGIQYIQDQTRRSTDWESFLAQNSGGQAL